MKRLALFVIITIAFGFILKGNNSSAFYKCFSCGEYRDVISWKVKEVS